MITVKNYSIKLGEFSLRNINLEIKDKEIFAIIGHTGAGKSILLESLAGLHDDFTGEIYYKNSPVHLIPLSKREIAFVYQDYSLFPHMTVSANIEFGLKMSGYSKSESNKISNEIMKKMKIYHLKSRFPKKLSGGEQQRTSLARALVLKPNILFMDEPFSALDPNTKKEMYQLIRNIHKTYQCTIVFVTHNFEEALELADRVGVMIDGELKTVCESESLFCKEHDTEVCNFLGGYNFE